MLIVNDQSINPMPVITGAAEYPDDILDRLKKSTAKAIIINAIDIAKEIAHSCSQLSIVRSFSKIHRYGL